MSLFIASLNSGSNGNCYYVGNDTEAVIVDVGLRCKEVERRMQQIGLSMQKVKAIFISHEHSDHIKGVSVLARKYKLPVYITGKTRHRGIHGINHLYHDFEADQSIAIGDLLVTPFTKQHDAIDPHSFIITHKNTTVGVFTDIGSVCKEVIHYFKQCNAIFLEANYDEVMLEKGSYPVILKNRIRGGQGHLSNKQALELFKKHKPKFMSHILLSHLSKENNTPELAHELFMAHAKNTFVTVASRYEASAVYEITSTSDFQPKAVSRLKKVLQLALFE